MCHSNWWLSSHKAHALTKEAYYVYARSCCIVRRLDICLAGPRAGMHRELTSWRGFFFRFFFTPLYTCFFSISEGRGKGFGLNDGWHFLVQPFTEELDPNRIWQKQTRRWWTWTEWAQGRNGCELFGWGQYAIGKKGTKEHKEATNYQKTRLIFGLQQ